MSRFLDLADHDLPLRTLPRIFYRRSTIEAVEEKAIGGRSLSARKLELRYPPSPYFQNLAGN